MAIVSFDIDEFFFPWREALVQFTNKNFNTKFRVEEFGEFEIFSFLYKEYRELYNGIFSQGTKFDYIRKMAGAGFLSSMPPFPGSALVTEHARVQGHNVAIITNRASREDPHKYYQDGLQLTEKWLKDNLIHYDVIEFTDDKAQALSRLEERFGNKVLFHGDDQPKKAIEVVKAGYKAVIIDKPYNQRELLDETPGNRTHYGSGIKIEEWHEVLDSGLVQRVKSIQDIVSLIPASQKT